MRRNVASWGTKNPEMTTTLIAQVIEKGFLNSLTIFRDGNCF
jgi:hypothetical protein